jgi:hypothetical protein
MHIRHTPYNEPLSPPQPSSLSLISLRQLFRSLEWRTCFLGPMLCQDNAYPVAKLSLLMSSFEFVKLISLIFHIWHLEESCECCLHISIFPEYSLIYILVDIFFTRWWERSKLNLEQQIVILTKLFWNHFSKTLYIYLYWFTVYLVLM